MKSQLARWLSWPGAVSWRPAGRRELDGLRSDGAGALARPPRARGGCRGAPRDPGRELLGAVGLRRDLAARLLTSLRGARAGGNAVHADANRRASALWPSGARAGADPHVPRDRATAAGRAVSRVVRGAERVRGPDARAEERRLACGHDGAADGLLGARRALGGGQANRAHVR